MSFKSSSRSTAIYFFPWHAKQLVKHSDKHFSFLSKVKKSIEKFSQTKAFRNNLLIFSSFVIAVIKASLVYSHTQPHDKVILESKKKIFVLRKRH